MSELTREQLIADLTLALRNQEPTGEEVPAWGVTMVQSRVGLDFLERGQAIAISRRYVEAIIKHLSDNNPGA